MTLLRGSAGLLNHIHSSRPDPVVNFSDAVLVALRLPCQSFPLAPSSALPYSPTPRSDQLPKLRTQQATPLPPSCTKDPLPSSPCSTQESRAHPTKHRTHPRSGAPTPLSCPKDAHLQCPLRAQATHASLINKAL